MRIAAALAWFDEPPAFLDRLVRSLAGNVDYLVAVDGRWRHHADGTHAASPRSQLRQISDTAHAVGLRLTLATTDTPWPSQVKKRDWTMRFAEQCGDWVLVVDGDTYLDIFDGDAVRDALSATDRDVATVSVRNLNRPWPYAHLAPTTQAARMIYRAGVRVPGPAHNDYTRAAARLNGDPSPGALSPALDLTGQVTLAHDNRNRGDARNAAAARYRRERRAHRVEAAR